MRTHLSESGASLIETMIAITIFGILVVSIYPSFTEIQKIGRGTNIKRLCQQIVATKLEDYKTGLKTDFSLYLKNPDGSTPAPDTNQLSALSIESYTDSSHTGGTSSGRLLTGFSYAKIRYNQFFPDSCIGKSQSTLIRPNGTLAAGAATYDQLGIRECVTSTKGWVDVATKPGDPSACPAGDDATVRELPGFKLYVKLELDSPWKYPSADKVSVPTTANPKPTISERLHSTCPNVGIQSAYAGYDFSGQSEGIKVTVTGVIDIPSTGFKNNTGMYTIQQLTCQAAATVTPYRYPVRYVVNNQSKILTVHGTGWNRAGLDTGTSSTNNSMVFRDLYETSTSTNSTTAILGISVHPRDAAIWVLKSGSLTRYSDCSGIPVNCNANASSGFPDVDPATPGSTNTGSWSGWSGVEEWKIPSAITSFGVDYRTGRVYGFSKSQSGGKFIELFADSGFSQPLGSVKGTGADVSANIQSIECVDGAGAQAVCDPANPALRPQFPRPSFTVLPARINSFFMSPSGDVAFVSDNTISSALGDQVYYSTIYRISDQTLSTPIMSFPFTVVGYSQ